MGGASAAGSAAAAGGDASDVASVRAAAASRNPKRCGRCRVARYCGSACQHADWLRHRAECVVDSASGGDGGGLVGLAGAGGGGV